MGPEKVASILHFYMKNFHFLMYGSAVKSGYLPLAAVRSREIRTPASEEPEPDGDVFCKETCVYTRCAVWYSWCFYIGRLLLYSRNVQYYDINT